MDTSRHVRTDLVIHITLAETFLLLLFVVWYSYPKSPDVMEPLKERIARLEGEIRVLRSDSAAAQREIENLRRKLQIWRLLTGFEEPPSENDLVEWKKEACRSHPRCNPMNLVVEATVDNGRTSVVVLRDFQELGRWLGASLLQTIKVGSPITEREVITGFLEAIQRYYAERRSNGTDCRFDYRLRYRTKEDYYDGRELFERYFYPAGVAPVKESTELGNHTELRFSEVGAHKSRPVGVLLLPAQALAPGFN